MKEIDIPIYSIPLSIKKESLIELREQLSDDITLHDTIVQYSKILEKQDIETWEIDRNLIVTEDGYKIAIYDV